MQRALLAQPQGVHQTIALCTAAFCVSAATYQLCSGLGGSARASRRQQLVRSMGAVQLQQPSEIDHLSAFQASADETNHSRPKRLQLLTNALQPKGPGSNDRTASERVLNVLTSVPFLLVGSDLLRSKDSSPQVQLVGSSLLLAGGAACAYHATDPAGAQSSKLRSMLRKLDYYTVALATAALVHAAGPEASHVTSLSSLAFVPYRPTAVTLSNISAVEMHLLQRAWKEPALRSAYGRHVAALAAGGACFAGETTAIKHDVSFVHALWHCFAACAVSTGAKLL